MTWQVTADPLEPSEAVAWFRARVPMLPSEYALLSTDAQRHAFTVANAASLEMVTGVYDALERAIRTGSTLEDFKDEVRAMLASAYGTGGTAASQLGGYKLELMFRNHVQKALNAGRYQQLLEPDILETRPYWMYDAILDRATTPICNALNGAIAPADDAYWQTRVPPLHHRCRSGLRALTLEQATDRGIPTTPPQNQPSSGFGAAPGRDEWQPDVNKYPPELWAAYLKKHGLDPATKQVKPLTAADITAKQIGVQAGSNPGGLYEGADGVKRYVKFYADEAQARGEALTNEIYNALGLGAPRALVMPHKGAWLYASEYLDNAVPLALTKKNAETVLNGFVADVFSSNWDAVGLSLDNIVQVGTGKAAKLYRIDNGGSLLYRAKAGRKPVAALAQLTEWQGFQTHNPSYAKVFSAAGITNPDAMASKIVTQLKALEKLEKTAGGWDAFITTHQPDWMGADRDAVLDMLTARAKLLRAERSRLEKLIRANRAAAKAVIPAPNSAKVVLEWAQLEAIFKTYAVNSTSASGLTAGFASSAGLASDELLAMRTFMGEWATSGYGHKVIGQAWIKRVRECLTDLLSGKPASNAKQATLRRIIQSRSQRLEAMLTHFKLPAPTHLRLVRGVQGEIFVQDVAASWLDSSTNQIRVRSYEVSSWSFKSKAAESFAGQSTAVVFRGDVPVRYTLMDQITDDAAFLTNYTNEHECLVGMDKADDLVLSDKTLVEVYFAGKKYTYADRTDLLQAMQKAGVSPTSSLPKP